jgi:hypothetical protein
MGILAKKFTYNGVTIPCAYLGINKGTSWTNLEETKIAFKVWASLDARVKGAEPIGVFKVALSQKDITSMPIFKAVYEKIKEVCEDYEDLKDFETAGTPEDISVVLTGENYVITGKAGLSGDKVHSSEGYKVTQQGRDFSIVISTAVAALQGLGFVYAECENMLRSSSVTLVIPTPKINLEK